MFTGLIRELGRLSHRADLGFGMKVSIQLPLLSQDANLGDSIAINGVCLTVVAKNQELLDFEVSPETLGKTNLGLLANGEWVNGEPSLRAGDPLGGHFVQGHVEGMGALKERKLDGGWEVFVFQNPEKLAPYLAPKGSIAVDGVSLTVVEAGRDWFSVALIPHTLKNTNLGGMKVGTQVNLETDMLARYLDRIVAYRNFQ